VCVRDLTFPTPEDWSEYSKKLAKTAKTSKKRKTAAAAEEEEGQEDLDGDQREPDDAESVGDGEDYDEDMEAEYFAANQQDEEQQRYNETDEAQEEESREEEIMDVEDEEIVIAPARRPKRKFLKDSESEGDTLSGSDDESGVQSCASRHAWESRSGAHSSSLSPASRSPGPRKKLRLQSNSEGSSPKGAQLIGLLNRLRSQAHKTG